MKFDQLFQVLSAIHPVSEKFKSAIKKELTPLSLPKNYLLLEPPRIAEYAYFLNKGFAMAYTFGNGQKCIEGFWQSGQIVMSAKSFFEQVPSLEFIQLMEKSEVLCISYAGVQQLFEAFPEAHFIYGVVMNQYYEQSKERIRDVHQLNAEQRHEKLLSRFSNIEQTISQEHIASYLVITPQSLSRIKRQRGSSSPRPS